MQHHADGADEQQDYLKLVSSVRDELLAAQVDMRKRHEFAVALIVTGIPAAGRTETVNKLLEWLDPKHVSVHAFGPRSEVDETYPAMWRYWRTLPARGRLAIYFAGWYGEYLSCRMRDSRKAQRRARRMRDRIQQLETMLRADGIRILKVHLHVDAKTQRKRLEKLRADKLTRWRVTREDIWLAHHYRAVQRTVERCLNDTDHAAAPWHVIDATNADYRELTVGGLLRDEMRTAVAGASDRERPRVVAASKKSTLRVTDVGKISVKNYEHDLERCQGRLAALTRHKRFSKRGLVLAFEGMDAAGKGGAIQRVTQSLDARQYHVVPISAPSPEERLYPYLWRFWLALPQRGRVAIFDRTWYGRVLVERVRGFTPAADWQRAYDEIRELERQLVEAGLVVAKFWLSVSKAEQLARFRARDTDPLKRFKVDPEDWVNRRHYDAYQVAAAEMIRRTDAKHARWTVVASDDKQHTRLAVLKVICETLEREL